MMASSVLNSALSATKYGASALTSVVFRHQSDSGSDLDRFYKIKIRPLIDATDQLRGLLANENIKLPSIVVVGDQSSGKSSVLEALSGVSLPRGQSITTRCPLVLRLNDLSSEENKASTPYARIGTDPNKGENIPLERCAEKIEEYTRKIAGHGVACSKDPIYLAVYRAGCPDLTLVDLPGITRNPVGDQPKDIYQQIKEMIYHFILSDEAIILNCIPADIDISTAECLMMSKEVNPEGDRTIVVVTKTDKADKGIRHKLEQGVSGLNFRLGLVAVKNRSQEDNEKGVTWEQGRAHEQTYFKTHPELGSIFNDTTGIHSFGLGTAKLAELLTMVQEQKIRSVLPRVRGQVLERLEKDKAELYKLPSTFRTPLEARHNFNSMLQQFLTSVSSLCRGDHIPADDDKKLHINPRLYQLFELFQTQLHDQISSPLTEDYAVAVQEELREHYGISLPNMTPPAALSSLMHREVAKMRAPVLALVGGARALLSSFLLQMCSKHFKHFPALCQKMQEESQSFLDICSRVLQQRVEETLAQEEEIFTINPAYIDTITKVKTALDKLIQQDANRKAVQFQVNDLVCTVDLNAISRVPAPVRDIQINIFSYSHVVMKRLADGIPMLIRYHMVRGLHRPLLPNLALSSSSSDSSNLPLSLISKIQSATWFTQEDKLFELMKEPAEIALKREHLSSSIARLEEAMKVFEKL